MRKIPTLYVRDEATNRKYVKAEVTPGCEWVLSGEGLPTRKYDGTCCLVRDGVLYKRREVKDGKPTPDGFEEVEHDETTGKRVGWVRCEDTSEDRWHKEAFVDMLNYGYLRDGTYELVGPKVQGNPEGYTSHHLIPHDDADKVDIDLPFPVNAQFLFGYLRAMLADLPIEGIVWHHPDGRMAKIKRRDFRVAT